MAPVTGVFIPVTPSKLARSLAELMHDRDCAHPLRVGVDGPGWTRPVALAAAVADHLRSAGRPSAVIDSSSFWRDASVRLEFGRTDALAYYELWLDADALNREVLDRVARGEYLPSLRDPTTNRATKLAYHPIADNGVVLVSGEVLLGRDLHFDLTIHLSTSPSARLRKTPPDQQWTLLAFDRYEVEVRPADVADAVVSMNDPAHPALRVGAA